MNYNRLLEKQIKNILSQATLELPDVAQLLEAVNNSYIEYEKGNELTERAFRISEEEYIELNEKLKEELEIKRQAIDNLKEEIDLTNLDEGVKEQSDDILTITKNTNYQIRKRKQAEKIFTTYFNNINSAILLKDDFGIVVFVNQLFCDLFNISQMPYEVIGADYYNIKFSLKDNFKDPDKYLETINFQLTKKEASIEIIEFKDGRIFELNYIPFFTEQEYKGHVWQYTDITERITAQKMLQQSEETSRLVMNASLNAIININKIGKIIFWNKNAEQIFGWKEEEALGQYLTDTIIPTYHRDGHNRGMSHYLSTGEERISKKLLNLPALHKDGTEFPIELSITPFHQNGETYFCAFISDVTERKRTEEKITNISRLLTESQTMAKIGSWEVNIENNKVVWSDELYRLRGLIPGEQEASSALFYSCLHPDDIAKTSEVIEHRTNENTQYDVYYRVILPDGTIRIQHDKGESVFDEHNNLIKTRGTVQDVTELIKAEEELLNQKKFTEDILNNIPADIAVFDSNHNYLFINKNGVKDDQLREWLIGKNDFDYSKRIKSIDKLASKRRDNFNKTLANRQTVEWVDEHLKESGEQVYIMRRFYPHIVNDKVEFVIGYGIDITPIKKIEMILKVAYDENNEILESIGDSFFTVNEKWEITYWNKKAELITGYLHEKVIGRKLQDLFNKEEYSNCFTHWENSMYNKTIERFEWTINHKNIWVEMNSYPTARGISVYFTDQTKRRILDEKLKHLNISLLEQTKKLEISNKDLEQYAYTASHDLQEPLRMISSFLTKLEAKYAGQLDEKGIQYLNFALDGAKRMRQIILDLLDYSRAGTTSYDIEDVDVNKVLEDVVSLLSGVITDKKATIHYDTTMPVIKGAYTTLRLILQNLIVNGLKYQHEGVEPVIHISCEDKQSHWQFAVTDNGIGISAEYFDKIFIIFQRLHSKSEYSGTGIGLAITKKIIENNGGKIWVESQKDKGSTFYFTITKDK